MRRPRILLTGFEPFQRWERNPSAELVQELQEEPFPAELEGAILPVRFGETGEQIRSLIRKRLPDIVLMCGLSPSTSAVRLERLGINFRRGGPDNAGRTVAGEPIRPGAPAAYFAPWPVEALLEWLRAEGVPAIDSFHAGTFLCNEALFSALDERERLNRPLLAGFLHLPPFPEMVSNEQASLDRNLQRLALRGALRLCLEAIQTG